MYLLYCSIWVEINQKLIPHRALILEILRPNRQMRSWHQSLIKCWKEQFFIFLYDLFERRFIKVKSLTNCT